VNHDGHAIPFPVVERGGTHPLAGRPVNPGLLPQTDRSDRHAGGAEPGVPASESPVGQPRTGCQPARRPGRDPGSRPYSPHHRKTARSRAGKHYPHPPWPNCAIEPARKADSTAPRQQPETPEVQAEIGGDLLVFPLFAADVRFADRGTLPPAETCSSWRLDLFPLGGEFPRKPDGSGRELDGSGREPDGSGRERWTGSAGNADGGQPETRTGSAGTGRVQPVRGSRM